jgi:hypothetical protein
MSGSAPFFLLIERGVQQPSRGNAEARQAGAQPFELALPLLRVNRSAGLTRSALPRIFEIAAPNDDVLEAEARKSTATTPA